MLQVVLVDDEQVILSGLKRVIRWEEYGCTVVGTASDGQSGLELIREKQPDILITDIRMPNMDGLTMIAALRSEFPQMQVTILTGFRDFDYARRAISLGVCRYLLKPSKMDELQEAIEAMAAGCQPVSPKEDAQPTAAEESEASMVIIRAALAYIQQHYAERIRLADVAESVYVSQWHLSKLINKHLGKSFFDLINEQRIQESQRLLANPSLKVHEVSEIVGFSDVAHFSKTFKRITGKSPLEYRSCILGQKP